MHDKQSGIWIDVEVDEPWFKKDGNRVASHYIGKDNTRNDFFIDHHWIIVRFAESQVAQDTTSCVKVIANLIDQLRNQEEFSSNMSHIRELQEVPQWDQYSALDISRDFANKPR